MTAPSHITTRQAAERRDLDAAAQAQVGDAPVMLKPGQRSCAVCGIACQSEGPPKVVVEAVGRRGTPQPQPVDGLPAKTYITELDICPACQERADRAAAIIAGHPNVAAKMGPDTARLMLEHAFAAMTAVGQKVPDTLTPALLASMLHRLAAPGAGCRWSAGLAPVQTVNPRTCNQYPFAHIPPSQRHALREAFAATLNDRMALTRPSQHLAPPPVANGGIPIGDGCCLCGVGQVTKSAAEISALGGLMAARKEVWEPISAPPDALGGRRNPQRLSGYTCPDCSSALASVQSIGQTAMARAYAKHLRRVGREDEALRVDRGDVTLVGWAARAWSLRQRGHAAVPNQTPWSHIQMRWSE